MVRAAALALAAVAFAGPAKMVVMNGQSVTITDYASLARCQEARRVMVEIIQRGEPTANGGSAVRVGVSIYCIPG